MENLVWIGTAITLLGFLGLMFCVVKVALAKRKNLSDDELRAEIQKLIPINLGTLLLSALGLGLVVVGLFLA